MVTLMAMVTWISFLVANGGLPRVLRNDQQLGNHWLRIKLQGDPNNRDALGAQVRIDHHRGQANPLRYSYAQLPQPV